MIEPVRQQDISSLPGTMPAGDPLPLAANDRAGWWNAAPTDVRIAANDTNLTGRAQTNALIADDVYRSEPTPPAGYRVASAEDLDRLGITPEMLEQPGSSFRARVYATGAGRRPNMSSPFADRPPVRTGAIMSSRRSGLIPKATPKHSKSAARLREATKTSPSPAIRWAAASHRPPRSPPAERRTPLTPPGFRTTRSTQRAG